MKRSGLLAVLVLIVVVAAVGCKKVEPTVVVDVGSADPASGGPPADLAGVNGLVLGTLRLEGMQDAVTPAQAAELLPLWQVVESGSLQGAAETQAVLKQIEGKMTETQLSAIDAMSLTWQDMQDWMEEQGIEMPERPGTSGQGGPGAFQNMSEEERNKMREEFQSMTPEQRATRMAEMGFERPQGGGPGGGFSRGGARGGNALLTLLIELLTERAAE
jgi:hypothetical protein